MRPRHGNAAALAAAVALSAGGCTTPPASSAVDLEPKGRVVVNGRIVTLTVNWSARKVAGQRVMAVIRPPLGSRPAVTKAGAAALLENDLYRNAKRELRGELVMTEGAQVPGRRGSISLELQSIRGELSDIGWRIWLAHGTGGEVIVERVRLR